MVRSKYIRAAALLLAMTGTVRSQQATADPRHSGKEAGIVVLEEFGRAPQRCRLLKSWVQPEGGKAFLVQAIDTHEMITVFEAHSSSPSGGPGTQLESRIVHWGSAGYPPAGTPRPPADAVVYATPVSDHAASNSLRPESAPQPVKPVPPSQPGGRWSDAIISVKKAPAPQSPSPDMVKVPTPPPSAPIVVHDDIKMTLVPGPVQIVQNPVVPPPPVFTPDPKKETKIVQPPVMTQTPVVMQTPVVKQPTPVVVPTPVVKPATPAAIQTPVVTRTPAPAKTPANWPVDAKQTTTSNGITRLTPSSNTWPTAQPLLPGPNDPAVSTWSTAKAPAAVVTTPPAASTTTRTTTPPPALGYAPVPVVTKTAVPPPVPAAPTPAVAPPARTTVAPPPANAAQAPVVASRTTVPPVTPAPSPTTTAPAVTSTWSPARTPAAPITVVPAPAATNSTPTVQVPAAPPTVVKTGVTSAASAPSIEALPNAQSAGTKPAGGDWQQSWGKVDKSKSAMLASAAPPSPGPVDPLMDPESFSRIRMEDQMLGKLNQQQGKTANTTVVAGAAKPATPAVDTKPVVPADTVQKAKAEKPVPAPIEPPLPTATQSSAAPPMPWLPNLNSSAPSTRAVPPAVNTTPIVPQFEPPAVPAPMAKPAPAPLPTANPGVSLVAPPPAVPAIGPPPMPRMISAAAAGTDDSGANAFSRYTPAPKANSGNLAADPPAISRMPGYSAMAPIPATYPRIPDPPALIAAAPSQGVVAAGFPVSAPPRAAALVVAEPANTVESGVSHRELIQTLKGSLYPSQREWAADRLTGYDWHKQPEVIDGLVAGARSDPAPLVRVSCLRALARLHADCDPALAVSRELRNDSDNRVRQEAESTLTVLQTARPKRQND